MKQKFCKFPLELKIMIYEYFDPKETPGIIVNINPDFYIYFEYTCLDKLEIDKFNYYINNYFFILCSFKKFKMYFRFNSNYNIKYYRKSTVKRIHQLLIKNGTRY